ncbi:transposase [Streptomyces sp. NPDC044571]|uniref:transposase n=1 Tax=Streptomyces sp. NPDC044571 TaxID=3155371 RepID=UPI0033FEC16D
MTDAEWAAVRPLLPTPSWLEGRGGQPEAYCHRQMRDAIRYLMADGISWRAMPADCPTGPGSTPSSAAGARTGWSCPCSRHLPQRPLSHDRPDKS